MHLTHVIYHRSLSIMLGIFGGCSLEAAIISVREDENTRFYGKSASPSEILFEKAVSAPTEKGVEELHHKLDLLREGKVLIPTAENLENKEKLRAAAEKAGVEAKGFQKDVVEVNATEEAKKEDSTFVN